MEIILNAVSLVFKVFKVLLKCLITEFSENKDLLLLLLYHADHNSKPLYFKSNKK